MRRTREEALETRERILDCAERVFADKGVAQATLADIAEAAGVTRGAIYGHFANKAEVFSAVVGRVTLPMDALFDAANDPGVTDPMAALHRAVGACLREVADNPRTGRVFAILLTNRDDGPAGWLGERASRVGVEGRARLAQALRNAVRNAQLPPDLDVERAAALLRAALGGVLRDWLIDPVGVSLPQDSERIAQSLLDMLRFSPALRGRPERTA